jgi:hypothetical protein
MYARAHTHTHTHTLMCARSTDIETEQRNDDHTSHHSDHHYNKNKTYNNKAQTNFFFNISKFTAQ